VYTGSSGARTFDKSDTGAALLPPPSTAIAGSSSPSTSSRKYGLTKNCCSSEFM
jgi:hypothetical protein